MRFPPVPGKNVSDHELAAILADNAGALLLDLRRRLAHRGAEVLRAEGDRRSHDLLCDQLSRARPDDAVLSEEGADDPSRLQCRRVWIVDPLDGTREFAEADRSDWAVHVALWEDGRLAAGAVALPARDLTCRTSAPPPPPPIHFGTVRLVVSRTRPPDLVEHLRRALEVELVPMGSTGAKAMAVVLGEADAYVHAGGQYEWDSAAPVAVALAAGAHASRIDGSPLRYNQPDPLLPDLVICRADLAGRILDAIAAHRDPTGAAP